MLEYESSGGMIYVLENAGWQQGAGEDIQTHRGRDIDRKYRERIKKEGRDTDRKRRKSKKTENDTIINIRYRKWKRKMDRK